MHTHMIDLFTLTPQQEPKATANLSYSSRSDADAKYIQEENEKLKQAIAVCNILKTLMTK